MGTNPPPGPDAGPTVGQRLDEAIELIEMELRHAFAYVNENVVPQVRRESVSAMRSIAQTLTDLADKMDKNTPKGPEKGTQL